MKALNFGRKRLLLEFHLLPFFSERLLLCFRSLGNEYAWIARALNDAVEQSVVSKQLLVWFVIFLNFLFWKGLELFDSYYFEKSFVELQSVRPYHRLQYVEFKRQQYLIQFMLISNYNTQQKLFIVWTLITSSNSYLLEPLLETYLIF